MITLLMSILLPIDSLDFIYDNFYDNQQNTSLELELVTDKSFYLPGEDILYFVNFHNGETADRESLVVQVFLFDNTNTIFANNYIMIEDGKEINGIPIPENLNTDHLYLALLSDYTPMVVQKIRILNGKANDLTYFNDIQISVKGKYLIPDVINEIKISTASKVNSNAKIVDENKSVITEFVLQSQVNVEFYPKRGHRYFLMIENHRWQLPPLQTKSIIDPQIQNDILYVDFNNSDFVNESKILMICAGNDILWLSEIENLKSPIKVPIDELNAQYLMCMLLNSNLELLDSKIISVPGEEFAPKQNVVGDTLFIEIPASEINKPFLIKAAESNWVESRYSFTENEREELERYGDIPEEIYFPNKSEKLVWLNRDFNINIKNLIFPKGPSKINNKVGRLIYNLPDNAKIDDHLTVNAIEYRGKIIDSKLLGNQISVDPNAFDNKESVVLVSANYKKKSLKVTKDTVSVKTELEALAKGFLESRISYFKSESEKNNEYLEKQDNSISGKTLSEVTIESKRGRKHFIGRGYNLDSDQIVVGKYDENALSLLPQVGIFTGPHTVTGHVSSSKKWLSRLHQYIGFYPIHLLIYGPSGLYYEGYDFRYLQEHKAKWVKSMTKINEQPETIIVRLNPYEEEIDQFVVYEKIFAQVYHNNNIGVLYWKYIPEGNTNYIKIPVDQLNGDLDWEVFFYDEIGTSLSISGTYRYDNPDD